MMMMLMIQGGLRAQEIILLNLHQDITQLFVMKAASVFLYLVKIVVVFNLIYIGFCAALLL